MHKGRDRVALIDPVPSHEVTCVECGAVPTYIAPGRHTSHEVTCVECGAVIVWVRSVECWSVNDDAWALSRCAGSFDVVHAPVVEVVR